jgi:hypothetical protein
MHTAPAFRAQFRKSPCARPLVACTCSAHNADLAELLRNCLGDIAEVVLYTLGARLEQRVRGVFEVEIVANVARESHAAVVGSPSADDGQHWLVMQLGRKGLDVLDDLGWQCGGERQVLALAFALGEIAGMNWKGHGGPELCRDSLSVSSSPGERSTAGGLAVYKARMLAGSPRRRSYRPFALASPPLQICSKLRSSRGAPLGAAP